MLISRVVCLLYLALILNVSCQTKNVEIQDLDGWQKLSFKEKLERSTAFYTNKNHNFVFDEKGINAILRDEYLNLRKIPQQELDFILKNFSNIKTLSIKSDKLNNIKFLSRHLNLTKFDFRGEGLLSIEPIQNLTKLKEVSIFGSKIKNVKPLNNLTNLDALNLGLHNKENFNGLALKSTPALHLGTPNTIDISLIDFYSGVASLQIYASNIENINKIKHVKISDFKLILSSKNEHDLSFLKNISNLVQIKLNKKIIGSQKSLIESLEKQGYEIFISKDKK